MTKYNLKKIERGYSWYNVNPETFAQIKELLEKDPNATEQDKERTLVDSRHYEIPKDAYSDETMNLLEHTYPSMFPVGLGRTLQIGGILLGAATTLYLVKLGLDSLFK